jgi:hypothetical protein
MPLDVQYVAEDITVNRALELSHGGKAAFSGAYTKYDASVATGGNGAFGLLSGEGKRLLTPYRLARPRHRNNLVDVQGMRGCKHDRLHVRIGNRVREIRADLESVLCCETGDRRGLVAHPPGEPQAFTLPLRSLDDRFAPSSQSDNRSVDHGRGHHFGRNMR